MWKNLIVYDIIPNKYIINENGVIYDILKNEYPKLYIMDGYYHINLQSIYGYNKSYTIHRLVLASFNMCNIVGKNICNHKDTNKLNNNINNLEYCTASENTRHAIQNKCRKLSEDNISPTYTGESNKSGLNPNICSVFNEDQVKYICERMQYSIPYPQILEELGLEVNKNYLDIMTKIRCKKLWYCISKDYNIPNKEYRTKEIHYSEDDIRKICTYINEGLSCPEIANKMNIKFTPKKEADKFRHFISRLKNKKTFVNITNDYF